MDKRFANLVAVAVGGLGGVLAQTLGLGVAPPRQELFLLSGEAFEFSIVVVNRGSAEETVRVSLASFRVTEGGEVERIAGEHPLCQALEVRPVFMTLPPGGGERVLVQGKAPPGEGTLACLITFTGGERPGGFPGIQLRPAVSVPLYVTLKGTERPALRAGVSGEGNRLALLLENPGNVLQRLTGEAQVYAPNGELVVHLPLGETVVWPGGRRRIVLQTQTPLPTGRYRVVLLLEGRYGRYAAQGEWRVP